MNLPEIRIGNKSRLLPVREIDTASSALDPRGIIWLFEPPRQTARYSMGIDPTHGRSGWSRYNRAEDDHVIDNGAIQVLRIGRGTPCKLCDPVTFKCTSPSPFHYSPDVQVAEFAAPIDPYDLATVGNALGRLYCGVNEDAQCPCIIEVYPGPGGPTQKTMMEKYGYQNMYQYQYMDGVQSTRKWDYGWYSGRQQVQHLWTKGLRFLSRRQVIIRSPWLAEELANCRMDLERNRGAAAPGLHDDRVTALLLSIWQGHNWSFSMEMDTITRAVVGVPGEWQAQAISSEKMLEQWNEKFDQLVAEAESEGVSY